MKTIHLLLFLFLFNFVNAQQWHLTTGLERRQINFIEQLDIKLIEGTQIVAFGNLMTKA